MDSELKPTIVEPKFGSTEGKPRGHPDSLKNTCYGEILEINRGLDECMRDSEQQMARLKNLRERTSRLEEQFQNPGSHVDASKRIINHLTEKENDSLDIKDKSQVATVDLEITGNTQNPENEVSKPLGKSKKQRLRRKRNREIAKARKLKQDDCENMTENTKDHPNLRDDHQREGTEAGNTYRDSCLEIAEVTLASDNDNLNDKMSADEATEARKRIIEVECGGKANAEESAKSDSARLKNLPEATTRLEEQLQNPVRHTNASKQMTDCFTEQTNDSLEKGGAAVVDKDKSAVPATDCETTGDTKSSDIEVNMPLTKSKKQRLRRKRNREIARALKLENTVKQDDCKNIKKDRIRHTTLEDDQQRAVTETNNTNRDLSIYTGKAHDDDKLDDKMSADDETEERKSIKAKAEESAIAEPVLKPEYAEAVIVNLDDQEKAIFEESKTERYSEIREATYLENAEENKVLSKSQKRRIRRKRIIEQIKARKLKQLAKQEATVSNTDYKGINSQAVSNFETTEADKIPDKEMTAEDIGTWEVLYSNDKRAEMENIQEICANMLTDEEEMMETTTLEALIGGTALTDKKDYQTNVYKLENTIKDELFVSVTSSKEKCMRYDNAGSSKTAEEEVMAKIGDEEEKELANQEVSIGKIEEKATAFKEVSEEIESIARCLSSKVNIARTKEDDIFEDKEEVDNIDTAKMRAETLQEVEKQALTKKESCICKNGDATTRNHSFYNLRSAKPGENIGYTSDTINIELMVTNKVSLNRNIGELTSMEENYTAIQESTKRLNGETIKFDRRSSVINKTDISVYTKRMELDDGNSSGTTWKELTMKNDKNQQIIKQKAHGSRNDDTIIGDKPSENLCQEIAKYIERIVKVCIVKVNHEEIMTVSRDISIAEVNAAGDIYIKERNEDANEKANNSDDKLILTEKVSANNCKDEERNMEDKRALIQDFTKRVNGKGIEFDEEQSDVDEMAKSANIKCKQSHDGTSATIEIIMTGDQKQEARKDDQILGNQPLKNIRTDEQDENLYEKVAEYIANIMKACVSKVMLEGTMAFYSDMPISVEEAVGNINTEGTGEKTKQENEKDRDDTFEDEFVLTKMSVNKVLERYIYIENKHAFNRKVTKRWCEEDVNLNGRQSIINEADTLINTKVMHKEGGIGSGSARTEVMMMGDKNQNLSIQKTHVGKIDNIIVEKQPLETVKTAEPDVYLRQKVAEYVTNIIKVCTRKVELEGTIGVYTNMSIAETNAVFNINTEGTSRETLQEDAEDKADTFDDKFILTKKSVNNYIEEESYIKDKHAFIQEFSKRLNREDINLNGRQNVINETDMSTNTECMQIEDREGSGGAEARMMDENQKTVHTSKADDISTGDQSCENISTAEQPECFYDQVKKYIENILKVCATKVTLENLNIYADMPTAEGVARTETREENVQTEANADASKVYGAHTFSKIKDEQALYMPTGVVADEVEMEIQKPKNGRVFLNHKTDTVKLMVTDKIPSYNDTGQKHYNREDRCTVTREVIGREMIRDIDAETVVLNSVSVMKMGKLLNTECKQLDDSDSGQAPEMEMIMTRDEKEHVVKSYMTYGDHHVLKNWQRKLNVGKVAIDFIYGCFCRQCCNTEFFNFSYLTSFMSSFVSSKLKDKPNKECFSRFFTSNIVRLLFIVVLICIAWFLFYYCYYAKLL